ncbi:MAG: single-stranded-DNA-specific exonuclease RecJ [Phycisphaerales bacterium]
MEVQHHAQPFPEPKPIRGMLGVWKRRGLTEPDPSAPLVSRVLASRGVASGDAAVRFLDPKIADLHDPSLLPGLERAAERVLNGVLRSEQIVIYGDYDVDGVTASAILFHVIREIARDRGVDARVRTYVPHRLEEGYGLNTEAIAELAREGTRLIISVDCGVTAFEPARAARAAGVDLIITDHHNLPTAEEGLPEAYAVVHPRLPGSAYPFGELCGAGVAFKLAWRLATMAAGGPKVGPMMRRVLLDMLALASLGVIADVVPLVDENRVIARHGLSMLRHCGIAGVRALVVASRLEGENIGEYDVGFKLAPRLNACGRMGHAKEAVELFTTAEGARADEIAAQLTEQNDRRRKTQDEILREALELAEREGMTGEDRRAIVLAREGWHAGVVGIVCSKLVERFHRPVLLMSLHDGLCHGSGRSVDGFDLHAAIGACSGHLVGFGGHAMAAGLRMSEHNLAAFTRDFCEFANARIGPEDLCARFAFDCDAAVSDLTRDAVDGLQRLAPFGRENPPVHVRLRSVIVAQRPETMGAGNKHLCLRVADARAGRQFRLVAWGWGERLSRFAAGREIQAIIAPKLSTWNGQTTVEGELVDACVGPANANGPGGVAGPLVS